MKRRIIGFDKDDKRDWRAELECGHYQHVRHDPPLIVRGWVLSEVGRNEKLGVELDCKKCETESVEQYGSSESINEFPEGMSAPDLIDHIIEKHHVFTRQELVRLADLLKDVEHCRSTETRPAVNELKQLFSTLYSDLFAHLRKEETIVFPYIRELNKANSIGKRPDAAAFGTVRNPIRSLRWEHEETNNVLKKMRKVAGEYRMSDGSCSLCKELYEGIEGLEADLQQHIHLENNVLFPLAGVIETRVFSNAGQETDVSN